MGRRSLKHPPPRLESPATPHGVAGISGGKNPTETMKTETETTASMKFTTTRLVNGGNTRIKVTIRLNDECKNGHEDFAITGETLEKDHRGTFREASAGCIHDEIAAHFPEFAPFIALHSSDWEGSPMHAMANGFYHFQEKAECAQEYIRATDEQWTAINAAQPRNEEEFSHLLETLGFRAQWKAEAEAATRQLEKLTGMKFESHATRRNWIPLHPAAVDLIREREASGYYTPEAIAARDTDKVAKARAKRIADIKADYSAAVSKASNKRLVDLYFAERDIDSGNVIFYDHTNMLEFNWHSSSHNKAWSQEEFADFLNGVDRSKLPEGIDFNLGNR